MAGRTIIDVGYYPQYIKKIAVMPLVVVPFGTAITWRIYIPNYNEPRRRQLLFTLYFEGPVPFAGEKKEIQQEVTGPVTEINAGEANKEGEFKYGIKARYENSARPIYDEDPYLVVLPPFVPVEILDIPLIPQFTPQQT